MRLSLVSTAFVLAFALVASASAQETEPPPPERQPRPQQPQAQQQESQQPQAQQQEPQQPQAQQQEPQQQQARQQPQAQQQPSQQPQAQQQEPQQQQAQQQEPQQQQTQGDQEGQQPYQADVEELAEQNDDFRRVLHTGSNVQLVVMSIRPGEDIGEESHPVEQCLYIVEGNGRAEVAGQSARLSSGSMVCVPSGATHNVINTGNEPLKLFTVYSPPEHAPNTVHATRDDAQREEQQPA